MTDHIEPRPWNSIQAEIIKLLDKVSEEEFRQLLSVFEGSSNRRWFFSGQGRSGLIAQMAAMRFMHLGFECHVTGEATAPAVRKGDYFVLVCGSGRTPVSKSFAEIAHAEGAELIVVTHKPNSEIAHDADVLLTVPMGETMQFGGTLFEQGALILLDCLALELVKKTDDAHNRMWQRHTNLQ